MTAMTTLGLGTNGILNAGILAGGMTASYEQLVLDDEMFGACLRLARGIEVSDATLALDLIEQVGPRGIYIDQRHTLKHLKAEHWLPRLSSRGTFDRWRERGGSDILTRARERVRELLQTHQPVPLADPAREEISRIVVDYERQVGASRT